MTDSKEDIRKMVSELTVLSFRKLEDVKKLARHFHYVINHPITQGSPSVTRYLKDIDKINRKIFLTKRDGVEVEYILTTEKKSSLQRQRFNSLPVSEVPELLKTEFLTAEPATQIHICTDCDVVIDLHDDIPLMESLQRHFNLEVHLPKLKRESIDVSEPVKLPNMSRRLSALESGEGGQDLADIIQANQTVKLDIEFAGKLEAAIIKQLPDNSEASVTAALKFYQSAYNKLGRHIWSMDFSTQTGSVAPIIMSIKDNVNQNFATDTNKNFETEENDHTPEKPIKNQIKKYRYYKPIENSIVELLNKHKLLTLADDRTGKQAFFCMACEYYTLRFRYDSVLNHVFNETHIHNLACILQADKYVKFSMEDASIDSIRYMNQKFLVEHGINDAVGQKCGLCKVTLESNDVINHILDENHLGRLSDQLYRKVKTNTDFSPDEWGPKSLDWVKFLANVAKPLNSRDYVVLENFIKPSGKIGNYCFCCAMNLKGPRQVLFNHIRQKKHLRKAAPHKLSLLYKNHCLPAEYYAGFGNFYICTICPNYIAVPSFGAIVNHFESDIHVESVTKLIRSALYPESDHKLLEMNRINISDVIECDLCHVVFKDHNEAVNHVLTNIEHKHLIAKLKTNWNRGDIISVYMNGNYILHSEGTSFTCVPCYGVYNSIRSLLVHLIFADHFPVKPTAENVFRFYLELKHNINMLSRNKYVYYEFGRLKCGVCDSRINETENAKSHVVSPRHRENMGASYVNVNLDVSAMD